jgi:hypothetical protein
MVDVLPLQLMLARDARLTATERDLVRGAQRGELIRLRSGVYVQTSDWAATDVDARYRARVAGAAAMVASEQVFSHDSAAAMWRLPSLGPWSPRVHVLADIASGGRSTPGIVRHGVGIDDAAVIIDDVKVSSLARTVLDIAMTSTFARAVAMIDDALRPPERGDFRFGSAPLDKTELTDLREIRSERRGATKAARAAEFATYQSGSIGESVSRVNFHLLRLPMPELQVPFFDEDGLIGYADFFWRELGLIGEFDGRVKYRDKLYLRGRLPEEVVWDEKQREDRLRRVSRHLVRWDWAVARDLARLRQRVAPFGLLPQH